MQCPRCGSDNKDSRVACWSCFAQLRPPVGGKPQLIQFDTTPAARSEDEQMVPPVENVQEAPVDSVESAAVTESQPAELSPAENSFFVPGLAELDAKPESEAEPGQPPAVDLSAFEPDSEAVETPASAGIAEEEDVAVPLFGTFTLEAQQPEDVTEADETAPFDIGQPLDLSQPGEEDEPFAPGVGVFSLDEPAPGGDEALADLASAEEDTDEDLSFGASAGPFRFDLDSLDEDVGESAPGDDADADDKA